jgi:hypothetical protein
MAKRIKANAKPAVTGRCSTAEALADLHNMQLRLRAGTIKGRVSLDDARECWGRKRFGNDWIGQLTADELAVLKNYGPKTDEKSGRRIIRPCPSEIARKLDLALGRCERLRAQWDTAADELLKRGPPFHFGTCNQRSFEEAVSKLDADDAPVQMPRPGRPGMLQKRVEQEMREDLKTGRLSFDDLRKLRGKDLVNRYHCGRTTARDARTAVIANSRLLATLDK